MTKTLTVSFNNLSVGESVEAVVFRAPSTVQAALVQAGYKLLVISGLPCDDLLTHVEDDLYQLLNSYFNLEKVIEEGKAATHSAFLGDGALVLIAHLDPPKVKIEIESTPHLRAVLAKSMSIETSVDQYLWSWRKVAQTAVVAMP